MSFTLRRCCAPALAIVAGLAGCAGHQTSTGGLIPQTDAAVSPQAASTLAQPDDSSLVTPVGVRIFVANRDSFTGKLLAFSSTGSGNIAPIQNIVGSNTTLTDTDSLALDAFGNIYVANDSGTQVAVFAPNANGNVKPIRIIGGSNSHLGPTEGLLVDSSSHLWVTDYANNEITEYPAGSSGNVAPIDTISGNNTQLNLPSGMAKSSSGQLFVANSRAASITAFANGASGNVAPILKIQGSNTHLSWPFAIAFDSNGRLLVADDDSGVLVFSKGAKGNVAPVARITGFAPSGVVADAADHIYAADYFGGSIKEFASNANGNATPLRTIHGSLTKLDGPTYLSLH